MTRAKTEYHLNQNQLHILSLLFKFRFITIPLLTTYKKLKSNSLQRAFDILLTQQYVERRFDSSYKLAHKPATYYLAVKGLAVLRDDPRIHPVTLHSFYKNKSVSEAFVQHTIDTLEVYNLLRRVYGDTFEMFSRQEVARFEDFPATKPDLYLRASKEYLVVLARDTPSFLVKKQLAEYLTHLDEDGWVTGKYPTLLFVFGDDNAKRRFLRFANNTLENAGIEEDELRIGTTTLQSLRTVPTGAIWTYTGEADHSTSSL